MGVTVMGWTAPLRHRLCQDGDRCLNPIDREAVHATDTPIDDGTSRIFVGEAGALCTKPLIFYLREQSRIFGFLFFASDLAHRADEGRLRAARVLANTSDANKRDEAQRLLEVVERNKEPTFQRLQQFNKIITDNMIAGFVNNFLCYLAELLQLCMVLRPELLRSSETVRLDDILSFNNFSDVIEYLSEKKINDLSYGGMRDIESFVKSRLGALLWMDDNERMLLILATELRNIVTHNRGRVNRLFLNKIQGLAHAFSFEIGNRHRIEFYDLVLLANNMATIAIRLDEQPAVKFGIDREPLTSSDG
jgi:hypothetical protein